MKRMTTGIEAILFDLDGTIIDTEPTAAAAVGSCFSEWNIPIILDDATFITGRTWNSAFQFLFEKYAIPVPEEKAKKMILDSYRQRIEKKLETVPGSVEAIRDLAQGFPLALVSGSGRSEILWALNRLNVIQHFQYILGAEDYAKSKPQPDGYLKAMTLLGKLPSSCLVFEDSTAGISSARAAGTWVVAVTSTNHFGQNFSQAHMTVENLVGVGAAWVKNLKLSNKV
jgi:HAD superfamily hydrolase (TIGR01509 family)